MIIQMSEAYNRTKNQIYDQCLYSQWNQLPPNLPLPNSLQVPALFLSFNKIIYLNQIGDRQSIQLRLQWWGMQKPHFIYMNQEDQKSIQVKYIICSSLEGLLSYLTDTKLLAVDVLIKRKSIGKAYINFTLLKGWKGQLYEGTMDIKHSKKKIGQISFSMEIKLQNNPYFNIESRKQSASTIKKAEAINPMSYNNLSNRKMSQQENNQIQSLSKENYNSRVKFTQKDVVMQSQRQKSLLSKVERSSAGVSILDRKERSTRNIYKNQPNYNIPLLESPIDKEQINYQKELVSLIEDFNYLFQKTGQSNIFEVSTENMIEIQILKLQLATKAEQNDQVEVIMPLPNGKSNIYRIIPGSFVKVCINQHNNKQQLFNYLKNSQIQFVTANKIQGSIKLSKVLSKCRQVIEVPLFQKDRRDNKLKQRGICQIRIIPPQIRNNREKQEPQFIKKQIEKKPEQQIITKPKFEEYISLFVKRFIPLQNWNRKANICVKVSSIDNELSFGQTKTAWNKNQLFSFDDKLIFKLTKETDLAIHLLDRQQKQIKIGEGELKLLGPIGVNLQIPIYSKHMNKRITIGYLQLDYVKNGLNGVTKMVDILSRTANNARSYPEQKVEPIEQEKKRLVQEEKQSRMKDQEDENYNYKQPINYDKESLQHQQIKPENIVQEQKPIVKSFDRNLCSLEIHNIFFTFLYQNTHLLEALQNKNEVKITQFLDIFSSLQNQNILTLKELNLIISRHLFASKQSERINKINVQKLKNSYQAFRTYYEDLAEQRDIILKEFLAILQRVGFSINDLQYKLKNNQQIQSKMGQFLRFGKGNNINIIEDIRRYYSEQESINKFRDIREVTGSQFCDILRRFEVYETTLGQKINYKIIQTEIYHQICELIVQIQPYIEEYTFRELVRLLQDEQIVLSSWEEQNLQQYLKNKQRNPRFIHSKVAHNQKDRQIKRQPTEKHQQKRQDNIQPNKPTISKSPTFGYLHAPEALKGEIITNDNYMVDSLGAKMSNIPISPINFHSSKQNTRTLKILFTNLKHKIRSLSIDGYLVHLNSVHQTHSKHLSQNQNLNLINKIHSQSASEQQINEISQNKTLKSMDYASKKQYQSANSQQQGKNMQVSLQNINKKFNYELQVDFGEHQYIQVECLHEEWTALVTQQGDYLGTVLIY